MPKKDKIEFEPIKQSGGGRVHLSIYLPDSFFGGGKYAVFVGGCGCGSKSTLPEAKEHLLKQAVEYCDYQVNNAAQVIAEYTAHKNALLKNGLKEK